MAIDPRSASVPEDPFPSVSDLVAHWGHAVMSVDYGQCSVPGCRCVRSATPWTYSVGLCDLGQPELVMLGLEPDITQTIINVVADRRRIGQLAVGETSFVYRTGRFRIVDVPDRWLLVDPNRMASWFEHYGASGAPLGELRIQQIVWPDRFGRHPDEPGCDPFVRRTQPVLRDHPMSYPKRPGVSSRTPRRRRRGRKG